MMRTIIDWGEYIRWWLVRGPSISFCSNTSEQCELFKISQAFSIKQSFHHCLYFLHPYAVMQENVYVVTLPTYMYFCAYWTYRPKTTPLKPNPDSRPGVLTSFAVSADTASRGRTIIKRPHIYPTRAKMTEIRQHGLEALPWRFSTRRSMSHSVKLSPCIA